MRLREEVKVSKSESNIKNDQIVRSLLRAECEKAKIALTNADKTVISV